MPYGMLRVVLLLLMYLLAMMHLAGCASPVAPTDCLAPDLEATYDKLEGVQVGDPEYAEAVRWASLCPEWGLLDTAN